jgi:hypothetical protein
VVPGQETISRDNVTMRVDAVIYYRVADPYKAIVSVRDYGIAVAQVAQTSLRAVTGRSDMDRLLSEREKVNAELTDLIGEPTGQPWGIRVEQVEVKDVSLPEATKRAMSRQAEAERERRARIIAADGGYQAARKLADAASVLAAGPAALQLRLLQTVAEVAAEKNSRVIFAAVPVEALRFPGHAASAAGPIASRGTPGCSRPCGRKPAGTTRRAGSPGSEPGGAEPAASQRPDQHNTTASPVRQAPRQNASQAAIVRAKPRRQAAARRGRPAYGRDHLQGRRARGCTIRAQAVSPH